ncbi:MAG: alpha/beta hydrolase [Paenibacillaceae bacterium]|nr:alpha/beta hydrolase [Paenibacillaceae bacterium]
MPIVFIHPPLLNQQIFNYQKAQLADSFKIITVDIRGHGHTPYSPVPVSYPLVVEDIRLLLDFLQIKQAVVCGYSTGGSIALEAMLAHPRLFVGGVLVSALSEASDWYLKGRLRLASGLSMLKAKRLLGGAIGWGNSDMSQTFGNLYRGAVQGDIRNIGEYYNCSIRYSCTDRLHRVKQPVLLLYGEKDVNFHRYAKLLDDRLPNRELVFIKEATHQIPTKAPRSMNRLLGTWMTRHFGGGRDQSMEEPSGRPASDFPAGAGVFAEIDGAGQQQL